MKTNKFLTVSLMATMILSSCSNSEDPANVPGANEIKLNAAIGVLTRAGEGVITDGWNQDLKIAFARNEANAWTVGDLKATRVGGTGSTPVVFAETQEYPAGNSSVSLIGYYPRPAAAVTVSSPMLSIPYTITGSEDIMATQVLTGSSNTKFTTPFTFQHLLAQLQFKCVASGDAQGLWSNIDLKVSQVPTTMTLKLEKTNGATLTLPSNNSDMATYGVPTSPSLTEDQNPQIGYTMIYPTSGLGSATPITLTIVAQYNGATVNKTLSINNIDGGVIAGTSHLITLVFSKDGEISSTAKADIAPWNPGNAGSGVVTPN